MAATAHLWGYEVPGWLPGTRHFWTDDGKVFAVVVHVDPGEIPMAAEALAETLGILGVSRDNVEVVQSPTHIIECRPDGLTESLTPVHVSEEPVSHAEALAQHGYTWIDPTDPEE